MKYISLIVLVLLFISCNKDDDSITDTPQAGLLQLSSVKIGSENLSPSGLNENQPVDEVVLLIFNQQLDTNSAFDAITLKDLNEAEVSSDFSFISNNTSISIRPDSLLKYDSEYELVIGEVKAASGDVFPGITYRFKTEPGNFELVLAEIDGVNMLDNASIQNIPTDFTIELTFSESLDPTTDFSNFFFLGSLQPTFELDTDKKNLRLSYSNSEYLNRYNFVISSNLRSEQDFRFQGFSKNFYTSIDSTYKFPLITDEELLTKVQEQTFKYFWDFAHPVSGLARERNSSGNTVTIGGSGFGVISILVGIERGFINRQEGIDRLEIIVNFLENADRFHGAWPHWMDGNTGTTIPFGTDDDGADLVETAFMIQGLLTVRQYLNPGNSQEQTIITKITQLWEAVEWDWFTKGGENVLYWHWSPNVAWQKNLQIRGWNESLIIYVLAASSPTHSISSAVYDQGWARNGGMLNGNDYYGITLPLGYTMGGPLFFAHYSFLGLDPRNLSDQYGNYWTQNVNHSLINQAYCIDNPKNYLIYSAACWGLTASDNHIGYSAHSPTNDLGVITPTAAISSIPYTPNESMDAIRFFYYYMGDKLWGEYGFYDAFNATENWYANSYLAIDQGPIVVMIENHRTGLIWDLFMDDPEVQAGLNKLGFSF
ncbi:hypothetical protein HZR84_09480 [Hyphobacterium sp. CCMP332]|nr:hypothetical protein HZR84_09480 [Hyphobacterium sp. CCMP332]